MSWVEKTLETLRKVALIDHRVENLERDVRDAQRDILAHDRRIQQLEFIIYGPVPPEQLRIPRN